jgi:hypothetical protein
MRRILLIPLLCFSAACTVGPNYKRPSIATPQAFRAPDPLPPDQAASIANLKWFEVFKDEQLQVLIRHALEPSHASKKLDPRLGLPAPISSRISGLELPSRSIAFRAMEPLPFLSKSFHRKIGISEPPRCNCCPSK